MNLYASPELSQVCLYIATPAFASSVRLPKDPPPPPHAMQSVPYFILKILLHTVIEVVEGVFLLSMGLSSNGLDFVAFSLFIARP